MGEGHPTDLGTGITPRDWWLPWGLGHPMSLGTALGTGSLAGPSTALGLESPQESGDGVTPQGWGWHWGWHRGQGGPRGLGMALGMESRCGSEAGPGDKVTPQMSQQVCGHAQPMVTPVLPINPHTERAALHKPLLPPGPTQGV